MSAKPVTGSLAGLLLFAALAAGCANSVSHPATPHHAAPIVTPPPSHSAHAKSTNPIPQNNGGDHDSDNSGGPSDGDGNI
jgi:hypothetical protein